MYISISSSELILISLKKIYIYLQNQVLTFDKIILSLDYIKESKMLGRDRYILHLKTVIDLRSRKSYDASCAVLQFLKLRIQSQFKPQILPNNAATVKVGLVKRVVYCQEGRRRNKLSHTFKRSDCSGQFGGVNANNFLFLFPNLDKLQENKLTNLNDEK